jgi:hypothetical protein
MAIMSGFVSILKSPGVKTAAAGPPIGVRSDTSVRVTTSHQETGPCQFIWARCGRGPKLADWSNEGPAEPFKSRSHFGIPDTALDGPTVGPIAPVAAVPSAASVYLFGCSRCSLALRTHNNGALHERAIRR